MSVTSRPVLAGDQPFLLDLYTATRAEEFAGVGWSPAAMRTFFDQQYRARAAGWAQSAPLADDLLLLREGNPLGRLILDRRADSIRVIDIALLPEKQGQGIGSAVLLEVLMEAAARGVPVTLHVVATSPARRLYERLGFRPVAGDPEDDGVYVPMERSPTVAQPNTAT